VKSSATADPLARIARHRLSGLLLTGPGLPTAAAVVNHLTAVQAQDHRFGRWSIGQRATSLTAAAVDAAFDEGRILRTHVLRPTWHYVVPADLRWLIPLSGPRVQRAMAPKCRQMGLDPSTLAAAADLIAAAVAEGPRTRDELRAALGQGRISTAGERTTFLLMNAELAGVICSGPMRGRQHTYAAFADRVPDGPTLRGEEALAELAYRYFSTRGPATVHDFSWWAGLSLAEARHGLDSVNDRLVSLTLGKQTYWSAEPVRPLPSTPQIDLVACYDEAVVSYRHPREPLCSPAAGLPPLQRVDGFQHGLLLDGRLVGHWRISSGPGEPLVEARTALRLGRSERAALTEACERCQLFAC